MQGWMEYIIKALHDNSSDLVGNILVEFSYCNTSTDTLYHVLIE